MTKSDTGVDELLPCPFCGTPISGVGRYECRNMNCKVICHTDDPVAWNTRALTKAKEQEKG